jgi:thymidylate synthase
MEINDYVKQTRRFNMEPFYYEATDINDGWFAFLYNVFNPKYSRRYKIERGSYEKEQERIEYFWATMRIKYPGKRPFVSMPEGSGLAPPTDDTTIENYFVNYLYDDKLEENELYRYSTSIRPQLDEVIKMLRDTPNTNQACMSIGSPDSIRLADPECLRCLDARVINNKLHFYVYFRSNDLYNAWPTNMGGIQLLKEFICSESDLEDGEILYSSKGLHIYGFSEELAQTRAQIFEVQNITKEW